MKKVTFLIITFVFSLSISAQSKPEFKDLVFSCFEKLDDGYSTEQVIDHLKTEFNAVELNAENNSYRAYKVELPSERLYTRVLIMSGRIGFEIPTHEIEDIGTIGRYFDATVNLFKSNGYLITINRNAGHYLLKRKEEKQWEAAFMIDIDRGRILIKQ